jgi:hypothetical protein
MYGQSVQLSSGVQVLKLSSLDSYFRVDKLQIVPTATDPDDCNRSGLNLCVRFEPSETTITGPGCEVVCSNWACQQWSTEGVNNNVLTWYAKNKACGSRPPTAGNGDRADDPDRMALVNGSTLNGGAADGGWAIRFTTQDMDDCVHTACGGWERSMANISMEDTAAHEGVTQWWAHSLYIPAGFVMPPDDMNPEHWEAMLFLEFHRESADGFDGGDQPMIPIELFKQPGTTPRTVFRVRMHGNKGLSDDNRQYVYSVPGKPDIGGQCIHTYTFPSTGRWYHFVHHIKFTANGGGFHKMWMREGTNPVKMVLNKTDVNALFPVPGGEKSYLVIGTYHDPHDNAATSTIHDRIRRGTSYEAVKHPDFPATLPSTLAPYDCAQ